MQREGSEVHGIEAEFRIEGRDGFDRNRFAEDAHGRAMMQQHTLLSRAANRFGRMGKQG